MSEAPTASAPSAPDRFVCRQRLFLEVVDAAGHLFYEGEYQGTNHDLPRAGVVAIEQAFVDLLATLVELGRQAAQAHGDAGPLPA